MKVLTVADNRSKCSILEQSLKTFGWDYEIIEGNWVGYSTKLHGIYAYLKAHPNLKDFIFTDAFDTMFIQEPKNFKPIAENFVSGETNCWTGKHDTETAKLFTSTEKFKYPNSGGFYMQSDFFIKQFEEHTPQETDDDQAWLIQMVLAYMYHRHKEVPTIHYNIHDYPTSIVRPHPIHVHVMKQSLIHYEYCYQYDDRVLPTL